MRDILPPKGVCSESRDLFKFWGKIDDISDTMHYRYIVVMKH